MKAHECFHCKQWIPAGVSMIAGRRPNALTKDLSEDLREAWERLRETAVEFGEQRIYASHHSIMFARKPATSSCGRRQPARIVFFVGRAVKSPLVPKFVAPRIRKAHVVHIVHRDQIGRP